MLSSKKIRIAYCLPSLYIKGGMERVLTLKANYFSENFGYEVYIINTDGKGRKPFYPLSPKVKLINLDVNFDEMFGKPFYKKAWLYLKKQQIYKKKLKKYLYDLKPDITVSMLRREIGFLPEIKDGSRKIAEAHAQKNVIRGAWGKVNYFKRIFARIWMQNLIHSLKKMDRLVILMHGDLANWRELDHVTVISNPVSFLPGEISSCTSTKVIAVGRYLPQKGFDRLIEAWGIVSKKHPDWTLHIYGEGMKEQLEKQIKELKLEKTCFLEDPVTNIADKYLESSIFVLSSLYEGLPLVVQEAMACGLAVVAFSMVGTQEVIRDGEDGILVENGNIPALAEQICRLIENPEIRRQIGERASVNIQRYKIDHIACQWKDLFESVLMNKEPSAEKQTDQVND